MNLDSWSVVRGSARDWTSGEIACLSLLLFVLLVPHRYLPPSSWSYLRWAPIALTSLFLVFAVKLRLHSVLGFPVLPVVGATVFIQLAGCMGSFDPRLAFSRVIYYTLTGAGVGLMVFLAVKDEVVATRLWRLIVLAGAGMAVYGAIEFVLQRNVLWDTAFALDNPTYAQFATDDFGLRIRSTVGHPVYLGAILACLIPLSLHLAVVDRGFMQVVSCTVFVAVLVGLVLTFTRGAYIAAGAGFAVYVASLSAKSRAVCLACSAGILLIAFSVDAIQDSLFQRNTLGQLQQIRSDQRGVAYRQATLLLMKSPLLGNGAGHYRYLAQEQLDYNQTPDNMYLRILVEGGVVATVGMVYLIVQVFGYMRRGIQALGDRDDRPLAYAILGAFVVLLVNMVTCDALQFPATRMLFWAVCGTGLALSTKNVDLNPASVA